MVPYIAVSYIAVSCIAVTCIEVSYIVVSSGLYWLVYWLWIAACSSLSVLPRQLNAAMSSCKALGLGLRLGLGLGLGLEQFLSVD